MKKAIKHAALGIICAVMIFNCVGADVTAAASEDILSESVPEENNENEETLTEESENEESQEEEIIEIESLEEAGAAASEDVENTENIENIEDYSEIEDSFDITDPDEDSDIELTGESYATSGSCGAEAKWAYDAGTKTLTISGKGAIKDYSQSAHAPWWDMNDNIKKIVIKEGITVVGEYAFYNSKYVIELSLADSITEIRKGAFSGSGKGYSEEEGKKLTEKIKPAAFPKHLTTIADYAFFDIRNLKTDASTLPACLKTIGQYAFSQNYGISGDLKLTDNCTKLGYRSFYSSSLNGCVTIPSSIKQIESDVFTWTRITGLKLPDTLTTIGYSAFEGCTALDLGDYTFPKELEAIGTNAFSNVHFTRITFGPKIKSVSGFRCHPYSYVEGDYGKGEDVTVIFTGDMPSFRASSTALQFDGYNVTAYYPKDNATWTEEKLERASENFYNVIWVKEGEKPKPKKDNLTYSYDSATATLTISGSGRMVSNYAPGEDKPWSAYIPVMKKLVIGDQVESIGKNAFYKAKNLETIVIGKSVKSIGKNAFYKSNVKDLSFPASLKEVDVTVIRSVKENVYFHGDPVEFLPGEDMSAHEMNIYYPMDNPKWTDSYITSFILHLGGLQFADLLFYPLEDKAGNSCGEKMTWSLKGGVLTISGSGKMADYRLSYSAPWLKYRKQIDKVVISEGVTTIGDFAFYGLRSGSGNLSMVIPSTVKRIGESSFSHLQSRSTAVAFSPDCHLEYVGVRAFYSANGIIDRIDQALLTVDTIEDCAFDGSYIQALYDLECNARVIGARAFASCRAMTSIKLGPRVKEIEGSAFTDCGKVTSIELGENIESIGNHAFRDSTVKELVIPDSVKKVGSEGLPIVTEKITVGKGLMDTIGFNNKKNKADIYFTGEYPDFKAMMTQGHIIHYPRYSVSWAKGIRNNGTGSLTFIPEGEERYVPCTVKFDTGCDIKVKNATIQFGNTVKEPALQKRSGYVFQGWYTEKEFINKYNFLDEVYENMTLYAKWFNEKEASWGDISEKDRQKMGFKSGLDVPEGLWICKIPEKRTYCGEAVTFKDLHIYRYKTLLTEKKDYTIAYKNNVNAGTATVTVTATGGKGESAVQTFEIKALSLGEILNKDYKLEDGSVMQLSVTIPGLIRYDGKVHKVEPSVSLIRDGKEIACKKDTDYSVVYDAGDDYKSAGSHKITLKGKGNISGSAQFTFEISDKKPISKATAKKLPALTANGNYMYHKSDAIRLTYSGKLLKQGEDYTVKYYDNKYVGTARVVITGIGKYYGEKVLTFKIKGMPLSKCYFGEVSKEAVYRDTGAVLDNTTVYLDSTKQKKMDSYTVSYANNKKPGTGTVIFKGTGFYEGTVKKKFKIVGYPFSKVKVSGIQKSMEYTGNPIHQFQVILRYKSKGYDADHTTTYMDNINVGTAKLRLHGVQYFYGDRNITFKITPFDVNKDNRAARSTTGKAGKDNRIIVKMADSYKDVKGGVKPQPEVYYVALSGSKVLLTANKDYSLSYSKVNSNGIGAVTVKFKGNFTGKLKYEFEVK